MSSPPERYDYAEGASNAEIDGVLSSQDQNATATTEGAGPSTGVPIRQRRDSQVGSAYDNSEFGDDEEPTNNDAIFDGYGARAIPSSVTSMHHDRVIAWGKDRRTSTSSRRPKLNRAGSTASGTSAVVGRRGEGYGSRSGLLGADDEGVFVSDDEILSPTGLEDEDLEDGRRSTTSKHSRYRSSRRSRKISETASPQKSNIFDSITGIFSRTDSGPLDLPPDGLSRRPSGSISSRRKPRSRRSASNASGSRAGSVAGGEPDSDEESWGYSSGEEDEPSADEASLAPSFVTGDGDSFYAASDSGSRPRSPTTSLPIITTTADPIFGDTRIDMDYELGFDDFSTPPSGGGPPSRQRIYIEDEDMTVLFVGCEVIAWRSFLWRLACVATFGILGLVGLWIPTLWLKWVTKEQAFEKLGGKGSGESLIVVETPYRDVFINKLVTVEYPDKISTIFPPKTPNLGSQKSSPQGSSTPQSAHRLETLGGGRTLNGYLHPNGLFDAMSTSTSRTLRLVDYRYARFVYDVNTSTFRILRDWRDSSSVSIVSVQDGINSSVRSQREILFEKNLIDVAGKSSLTLLVEEALHPFYVFQIASIILWSIDDYWYYATCIAIISGLSIVTTLVETKRTVERMREMSRFSCPARRLSDGKWETVSSEELVPGDIVNLIEESLSLFPADMLLLSGDTIVNESMLTGESVPVAKVPVKDHEIAKWNEGEDIGPETAKSFLYTGTKIIRVRGVLTPTGGGGEQALGLVVRTGFNTTKGSLIRSMLFPKPMGFKFYRDSMRFVIFLAGVAGLGFLASAVQFVKLGIKLHIIVLRALDLITIVVPPALPATLSIGTSFSIGRLRKLGIFCISPNRVNVAGKINVVCFDKTGTLTEDGLDVLGARCLDRTTLSGDVFGELVTDAMDIPQSGSVTSKADFLHALATCHSLKVINAEVLGDPLDVKMFEFTGWAIEEGRTNGGKGGSGAGANSSRPAALVQAVVRPPGSASFRVEDALKAGARHAHFLELGVIRTFDFMSSLRRMSVIVKRLKSTSMEIYVKGAPEIMADICDPSTFPKDYDDLLSYYTKHGYRVIAIAGKSIEGLSWLKAQRMKREQVESGLNFLGLIIFENKLKPGTAPAIQILQNAHLAIRMVTGDNHRTAISVARECGLISQSLHVFTPSFAVGNAQTPASKLEWSSVDDEELKLDPYSLKPLLSPHRVGDVHDISYQDYTLALTGDVFRWMINHAPLETLQRMFVKAQIFARMSPDEKHELVTRLQSLGYTVGFCGDGANDCGALKAADVGLSLSEAEASVAAPFTSSRPDISCVIEVIKEGRAALVTSFSCFKYMALYSIIQFTTITLLYSFASSLGDFQFLYIDLFIIIPIAVTMGRTHPYTSIHRQQPTASLVSKKVLSSIIGQILLTSAFQFWAFFWARSQSWYTPPSPSTGSDELETYNYENTVLFLISSFQYVFVAAVFSIGPPYRLPMWTNRLLVLSISLLSAFSVFVLLTPPEPLARLLDIMPLPSSARLTLLVAAMLNAALCLALERWAPIARLVTAISRQLKSRRRRAVREGKLYKAVEGGMR